MTRKARGFPTRRISVILPQKLYDKLVLIQHQEAISSISETIAYLIRKEKIKIEQQIVRMKSAVLTNQESEELLSEFLSQPRKEQEE